MYFFFQSGNKRDAEHLVKNIIKIVIKIGILHRNNQFNDDELKVADRFRTKFQVIDFEWNKYSNNLTN